MFLRNLLIVAIFAHQALHTAVLPMLAMCSVAAYWIYRDRNLAGELDSEVSLALGSPVAISKVMKFGLLFLAVQVLATVGQRFLGAAGFQIVSVLGGLVSSASTAAASANMAMHGKVTSAQAGIAVVLTSIASALVDLPIVQREVKNKTVVREFAISSFLQAGVAIAVLALQAKFIGIS
jgi:uncharacterized membrane protein (DUF4010 family)